MSSVLLSTTYFGPVQWYQKLFRAERVVVEQHENFQKQTYRNRCLIATANGIQALTVPVERGTKVSVSSGDIRDIRISEHGNWRHLHWNALCSAYGESPFFEFYADDLQPFFEKKWEFLFDFNMEITEKMCELIDIRPNISFSEEYSRTSYLVPRTSKNEVRDYRDAIRPKHPVADSDFVPKPYYQVYQQRHGFIPNLSVLDLLFNMGTEAIFYL